MSKALLLDVLQSPQDFGLKKEAIYEKQIRLNLGLLSDKKITLKELGISDGGARYWEEQAFTAEDMPFHAFLFEGRAVCIGRRPTTVKLPICRSDIFFSSFFSYLNSIKLINGLYASEKLGIEATLLTVEMYCRMPEILKEMCRWYWLYDDKWGLCYVDSSHYVRKVDEFVPNLGIRPTGFLAPNIYIETNQFWDSRGSLTPILL